MAVYADLALLAALVAAFLVRRTGWLASAILPDIALGTAISVAKPPIIRAYIEQMLVVVKCRYVVDGLSIERWSISNNIYYDWVAHHSVNHKEQYLAPNPIGIES